MSEEIKTFSVDTRFVEFIIDLLDEKNRGNDKRKPGSSAASAALKNAYNPKTEYQSWEYLARAEKRVGIYIDIENNDERLPYTTIASAMAKAKVEKNGTVQIGQAIAQCYDDGNESDQAKMKLRRLLACDTTEEVCRVLRPLFSLIEAKANVQLDYAKLLKNLLDFHFYSKDVKASWAHNFYHFKLKDEGDK
ncbi:MAG: type I-E CRISPR-associated protein Cse2/CasB [Methylococcales bacterium]|nr:type I-E CRISPR-associated protein Cse2/CasB [Methylococcales bacterium]MDD5753769.1 type I-E CRISPR-associated protein Cse2/CasB [Methylococcales bacterium]